MRRSSRWKAAAAVGAAGAMAAHVADYIVRGTGWEPGYGGRLLLLRGHVGIGGTVVGLADVDEKVPVIASHPVAPRWRLRQ